MPASRDRPHYILILLVLSYMSSYVDRVAVGIFAEAIKTDLKITDTHIGLLTGLTFVIFYSFLGVPIGRLADRFNRRWLLVCCLTLWSAMTAVSGFAQNFLHLMLARIGVGVGEAGLTPATHSLLSDLFPKNRRSMAFSVFGAGPPLGIIAGTLGGGWIAQEMGWRAGMIAVAVPGLILAALFAFTTREPKRGQQDDSSTLQEAPPPFLTTLATCLKDKLFVRVTIGMSCAAIALYSISTFAVPFLIRAYDLSLFAAASLFGFSYGVAGVVGASIGGIVTDWLGVRDARWYARLPMIGYAIGGASLVAALYQSDYRVFVALFVLGSVVVNMALAPSQAVVLARVGTRMRGSASALQLLSTGVFGLGVGPTLTGILSDLFATSHFSQGAFAASCPGGRAAEGATAAFRAACSDASFVGLQQGLTITLGFYVVAALVYVFAIRHTMSPVALEPPSDGLEPAR